MPHSLRVYKALRTAGIAEKEALCISEVVESAKSNSARYDRESILNGLCDGGLPEPLAEALCEALRNCFNGQRFSTHFDQTRLKTSLVRARMPAPAAESFLVALEPSVVTPRTAEVRQPVRHQPSPGIVVMCDFTHLRRPEMQKERRAIVVSARAIRDPGRCSVVPVSKLASTTPNPHHYEFPAGKYPFFHPTEPVWAVCDHIYTVALDRLWMVNVRHRPWPNARISNADLAQVRNVLNVDKGPGS